LSNLYTTYESVSKVLETHDIAAEPAEIQGMLVGMLAGGMSALSMDWSDALCDFVNQGEPFPQEVEEQLNGVFQQSCEQLRESDFALGLYIPNDDADINIRGQALIQWVQGFLLGFGLHQTDLSKASDDVQEVIADLADISRMDDEMTDDEDSEQAFTEVSEYVRVSAMLCFSEFATTDNTLDGTKETIH
jgi:yecA family protein